MPVFGVGRLSFYFVAVSVISVHYWFLYITGLAVFLPCASRRFGLLVVCVILWVRDLKEAAGRCFFFLFDSDRRCVVITFICSCRTRRCGLSLWMVWLLV